MSDIKKCDRCGATYKPEYNMKVTVETGKHWLDTDPTVSVHYDLCTACFAKLKEFLGGQNED